MTEPYDTHYGSREFTCRDLEGDVWSIGDRSMRDVGHVCIDASLVSVQPGQIGGRRRQT